MKSFKGEAPRLENSLRRLAERSQWRLQQVFRSDLQPKL